MNINAMDGVEKSVSAQCVSFVFCDPLAVSGTAYKVLRSQDPSRFIACVRSRANGLDKLTYLTRGYVALADLTADLSPKQMARLLTTAVDSLVFLRNNGFLSMQNVVFSQDMLYVDQRAHRLLLVYLPFSASTSGGNLDTARQAYRTCATALESVRVTGSPLSGFEETAAYRDGDLTALLSLLGGVGEKTREVNDGALPKKTARCTAAMPLTALLPNDKDYAWDGRDLAAPKPRWSLETVSLPKKKIPIPNDCAVMGKSPSRADVVLTMSPAISRIHCKVRLTQEFVEFEDLGSANGTFVRGARLKPGNIARAAEGDIVRFADVSFVVRRGR